MQTRTRKMNIWSIGLLMAVLLGVLSIGPALALGSWDLVTDWTDEPGQNPGWIWAYGYYEPSGFWGDMWEHVNDLWGTGTQAWIYPGPQIPNMFKNSTAGILNDIPVGAVGGHGPSQGAGQMGYTAARWTAPYDMSIDITGNVWFSIKDRPQAVSVFVEGVPVINSVPIPLSASSSAPYSLDSAVVDGGGNTASLRAVPVSAGQSVILGIKTLVTDGSWYGMNLTINEVTASNVVHDVVISPPSGTYTGSVSASMSCVTPGADIRYTTDGSDPTEASDQYFTEILVDQPVTVKAKAFKSGMTPSGITTATYQLKVPGPTFDPPSGSYETAQSVTISCAEPTATIYYTTDDSDPTDTNPASTEYTTPVTVSSATRLKAKAYKDGWVASDITEAMYLFGTWDLATEWNYPSNPSGSWSYGYWDGTNWTSLTRAISNL